jgi:hypothetical protein
MQIIGERAKTHFIPMNQSDSERLAATKTSVFNVCCSDVGRVTKLVIKTTNQISLINWHVETLEIKALSSNQTYKYNRIVEFFNLLE